MPTHDFYIGLMSGTSADGIDAALVDLGGAFPQLVATHQHEMPAAIKRDIVRLCQPGADEIQRMGTLDRTLGQLFSMATLTLLAQVGLRSADIRAIGSHGQTIRHSPPTATNNPAFTLQIGDPNTIAELTGITTVADFRRRDIAAGGHGAPLVPAFHCAVFRNPDRARVIVNIGGMANITWLPPAAAVLGFDTGPGNVLMDGWIFRHKQLPFDHNGAWAGSGTVDGQLLYSLLEHPFFRQPYPKSTGREMFHTEWLDSHLQGTTIPPENVQATLLELTARSVSEAIASLPGSAGAEIYLCGGGARNGRLLERLSQLCRHARVASTASIGIDPQWVEAMAFAWLAQQTVAGKAGNIPEVTGASAPRILGGVYPA